MQTIANDGERVRLQRGAVAQVKREALGQAVPEETAARLRRMLEVTVRSGTCNKAFRDKRGKRYLESVRIAAKTGTLVGGKPTRMFSWFAGFAPADKPEIAIAVMLANNVKWKTKGILVGRDMLRAYFEKI